MGEAQSEIVPTAQMEKDIVDDMIIDLRRLRIGKVVMIALSEIILKPIMELVGDDGILGRFFSNTQNPPG